MPRNPLQATVVTTTAFPPKVSSNLAVAEPPMSTTVSPAPVRATVAVTTVTSSPSFPSTAVPATETPDEPKSKLPPVFIALRNESFRYFWGGTFLSNIGTWMQNIAQSWLVLQLTNSSFWLGFVGFIASLPFMVFTLYGGVIADRVNKRTLLLCTQTTMMVLAFLMATLAYLKIITVKEVAVLTFINGIALALNAPAYQALLPQLVRREDMPNAVALNTVQFNLSRILGPTLGAMVMAVIGVSGNFFLNGISFVAVIFAIVRIDFPTSQKKAQKGSMISSLNEGFRYVRAHPEMFGIVCMVMSISLLLMPFINFMPYFAKNVLKVGEHGLGTLMACSGAGALVSALLVAQVGKVRHRGIVIYTSCVIVMAALVLFCFTQNFVLACAICTLEGFGMILAVSIMNMSMQQLATDEMRGRVMSIYAASFLGLPPFGSLVAGALSRKFTVPHVIAGMVLTAICSFTFVFTRMRGVREFD